MEAKVKYAENIMWGIPYIDSMYNYSVGNLGALVSDSGLLYTFYKPQPQFQNPNITIASSRGSEGWHNDYFQPTQYNYVPYIENIHKIKLGQCCNYIIYDHDYKLGLLGFNHTSSTLWDILQSPWANLTDTGYHNVLDVDDNTLISGWNEKENIFILFRNGELYSSLYGRESCNGFDGLHKIADNVVKVRGVRATDYHVDELGREEALLRGAYILFANGDLYQYRYNEYTGQSRQRVAINVMEFKLINCHYYMDTSTPNYFCNLMFKRTDGKIYRTYDNFLNVTEVTQFQGFKDYAPGYGWDGLDPDNGLVNLDFSADYWGINPHGKIVGFNTKGIQYDPIQYQTKIAESLGETFSFASDGPSLGKIPCSVIYNDGSFYDYMNDIAFNFSERLDSFQGIKQLTDRKQISSGNILKAPDQENLYIRMNTIQTDVEYLKPIKTGVVISKTNTHALVQPDSLNPDGTPSARIWVKIA